MQAIILAAGMGKRLGELTKGNTKCMVQVNGVCIIDRMLAQLSTLALDRVIIVVGYKGETLIEHIGNRYPDLNIEYIKNPVYDKTNNIYSLYLAKEELEKDDTLLLESDLVVDESILHLLMNDNRPTLALVAKYEKWMDGTMVCIDNDKNIVNFISKAAFSFDDVEKYYKTINIYKFSKEFIRSKYIPFLEAYTKAIGNNEYYENVLRILTLLDCCELKALPITNEKWYEIDDKQDLDIAEALFAEEKDILRKYYGRFGGFWRFPKMLDYCYLVNPYFGESKIIDEIQANMRTLIMEYPSGMKVNTLLASKCWGINEDYIVPGNGAAELIKVLMEQLPGKLGIIRPTFEEYPNRCTKESLITFVPGNDEYRYTADELIKFFSCNRPESILIINPDNPTGNFIPIGEVHRLAAWCEAQGIRLIVDESFVDFTDGWRENTLLHDSILEKYPHMIVIKSISKSYGVPGIRLGILCSADKDVVSGIKRSVSIWNINSFAEYFMQIYTKYEADYNHACDKFIEERNRFGELLRKVSFLRVIPSQANYFLVEVLPPYTANGLVLSMLKQYNILLRDCSTKEGLGNKQYMRIAVRGYEDNNKLLDALKQIDSER